MIYLSKLTLNPRSPKVRAEYMNPYAMHHTLGLAFGERPGAFANARCLFRVEAAGCGDEMTIFVQSSAPPNWKPIEAIGGYLDAPPALETMRPVFEAGERFGFRLLANPSVKRNGKRVGLYAPDECLEWLGRKAEMCGFAIERSDAPEIEKIAPLTNGERARMSSVLFQGVLVVRDALVFAESVKAGVGSAKGFGFGLLSLARP